MWRQNASLGNGDSDQSISDEEDLNGDLGENCFSLNTNIDKEEQGLSLHSRLEALRGSDDNQSSFFAEDEVEMPDFPDEGGLIVSQGKESTRHPNAENDNAFSKYSVTPGATKLQRSSDTFKREEHGACTWSMISKEADALIRLNDSAFSSGSDFSKANKSYKGVRGKVKPKFSLHFKSDKHAFPQLFISKNENVMSSSVRGMSEQLEPIENGPMENSNLEFLEDLRENHEHFLPAEVEVFGNGLIKHSIAELLDGLQDRNAELRGNCKMSRIASRGTSGMRAQLILKRSLSPLGERIGDNEEQPEPVESGSSGDDEANYQNLNLADPKIKKQTLADQFQEAFVTTFNNHGVHVTAAKLSGIGLFGKLQQVIQSEKERDTDFLKRLQMGLSPDDGSHYIIVKILSRCLDAKLIVCRCSFVRNAELQLPDSSRSLVDMGKEGTVIFSPKVCSNVDLEVENFICIHSPWKEVQVMGSDESIILSTYFSHI